MWILEIYVSISMMVTYGLYLVVSYRVSGPEPSAASDDQLAETGLQ